MSTPEGGTIIEEQIDEYHAKITVNEWITIKKGESLQYANETLTALWKVADGGKFTSVMIEGSKDTVTLTETCLLYTSPSPRDPKTSRMPSSA